MNCKTCNKEINDDKNYLHIEFICNRIPIKEGKVKEFHQQNSAYLCSLKCFDEWYEISKARRNEKTT